MFGSKKTPNSFVLLRKSKKPVFTLHILLTICLFGLPATAKYGGGNGTAEDPYLIYTAEQMNIIGTDAND